MVKISVAIATYNEEKNINRCLRSVAHFASEIVLVDGSSSDETVTIAKKYNCHIIIADNPINFHINKQKAIEKCQGDWILQLDADEEVSPLLKSEILENLNNISGTISGYKIPRKNFFLGRFLTKGGQFPDYTIRLYKRGKGRLPARSVHEQAEVDGEIGILKNPLIHYSYPDFSQYLTRFDRYTTFYAWQLKEKHLPLNFLSMVSYVFIKPTFWFFKTYIRHKGFMDGFGGFVFSVFSSLVYFVSYIKYWEASIKINYKNR